MGPRVGVSCIRVLDLRESPSSSSVVPAVPFGSLSWGLWLKGLRRFEGSDQTNIYGIWLVFRRALWAGVCKTVSGIT